MVRSPRLEDGAKDKAADLAALFVNRESLVSSLSKGLAQKALKLLVTMSTLLTAADHRRLGPHLWDQVQSDGDASLTASVCLSLLSL